jgi:hypothetical protein
VIDQATYEKALARAKAKHIRIAGESSIDGNRSWVVENPSHDGSYLVRLAAGSHELTCNCPARTYCKHRALVHDALEREAHAPHATLTAWTSPTGERITLPMLRIAREAALRQPNIWR